MSWIRDRLLPALAMALAAGLLASAPGCHDPLHAPEAAAHPEDLTPRRGGVLHLATIDDVRSLDPAAVLGGTEAQLDPLIYAGLVDIAADGSLVARSGRELGRVRRRSRRTASSCGAARASTTAARSPPPT